MPRGKRQVLDNGIYHILNRGHNKDWIFKEADDFYKFKEVIRRYEETYSFGLYHYCIMSNHFHLLMRIPKAEDLPVLMKGICRSYANYHGKTYNHTGYLFQNRYKSIYIDRDSYLLECARYIERNPLRANIVKNLSEYPWSSYNHYAKDDSDDIIILDPLYETLANTPKERRDAYIEYLTKPRPYEEILDERIATLK